ncbi:MAG TPA: glycosyl transferase family 1, partial [Promineifilum sp.]|nr:glycosyl transferase family 1 [Promineifilum sp.]
MRILFLSQLIPYPLDAGPKVRAYYVLRHLAEAGHEVTLLAFSRESDSAASIDHLRQFCVAVHTVPMPRSRPRDAYHAARSLLTGQPFLIARDHVPEMIEKV